MTSRRCCACSPCSPRHGALLVLEDLHDADLETVAVVEYLVDT